MEKDLELRMYFFVPYNISPIQQAIQAGHAVEQYAHKFHTFTEYINYVENWKTWIILNGGTTNSQRDFDGFSAGTLNQIADQISDFNGHCEEGKEINMAYFEEPDLNNALTAICFLADERVFNYEDYPDLEKYILFIDFPDDTKAKYDSFRIAGKNYEELKELFPEVYKQWENSLGGGRNVFLRKLLKGKKLA